MPYIITTKAPKPGREFESFDGVEESRRAVATLEEACDAVRVEVIMANGMYVHSHRAIHLPESGGTVGPLPDGTMIEVEHLSWADLRERAGLDRGGFTVDQVTLAAFNARQS